MWFLFYFYLFATLSTKQEPIVIYSEIIKKEGVSADIWLRIKTKKKHWTEQHYMHVY